jgi:glycosyltransferase involved in cell wall biosynthesis
MFLRAASMIRFKTNSFELKQVGFQDGESNIDTSIILPVFNQEGIIQKNLQALSSCIGTVSELIIINDASEDQTNEEILHFMKNFSPVQNRLRRIKCYTFKRQNFETYSDYIGISQSVGKYIIEVQADMRIMEENFDEKMINNLRNNPDVFMLSGRGIMTFNEILNNFRKSLGNEAVANGSILRKLLRRVVRNQSPKINTSHASVLCESNNLESFEPSKETFYLTKKAGRLGRLVEDNLKIQTKNLYVGETVMRGPICFNKEKYLSIGQFDKDSFFLGYDEHDLNIRARLHHNLKAGYLPISFESPLELGSMRKARSKKSRLEVLLAVKRTRSSLKNSQIFISAREGGLSFNDHEVRESI